MNYMEELNIKIKECLKARSPNGTVYKYFKSLLINNEKSKKPIKELDVLVAYNKKIKNSWLNVNGDTSTKLEIELLSDLLPTMMSDKEIVSFIEADGLFFKDHLGKTIGYYSSRLKGKAEGGMVAEIIKKMFNIDSSTQQAPEQPLSKGLHDYSFEEAKSGYGICKCGIRENTVMSLVTCPENK